jgi:hypothetical protein
MNASTSQREARSLKKAYGSNRFIAAFSQDRQRSY